MRALFVFLLLIAVLVQHVDAGAKAPGESSDCTEACTKNGANLSLSMHHTRALLDSTTPMLATSVLAPEGDRDS
jgi:hypothetical protein